MTTAIVEHETQIRKFGIMLTAKKFIEVSENNRRRRIQVHFGGNLKLITEAEVQAALNDIEHNTKKTFTTANTEFRQVYQEWAN